MTTLVLYLVLFLAVGVFFLFIHLVLGRLLRPTRTDRERLERPDLEEDRLTVYECGEPTIGSAFIQFDLRYYVVALLFVIFDVEVAFFFPWATVFGKANTLAQQSIPQDDPQRKRLTEELIPAALPPTRGPKALSPEPIDADTAYQFAWLAMIDMAVFFGVLLVGFAYLWRRGDIDWVRSTAAERLAAAHPKPAPVRHEAEALVGAGKS
jgi:NADH-quinone oxidoreductase subunit A